jgi:aspartate kinase
MPGTWVRATREHQLGKVLGVASASGFCAINMSKYLMNREVGFGRRLLEIVEDECLNYEHMPSGIDTVSLIVKGAGFSPEIESRVCDRIRAELAVDHVDVERGLALVMIVGEGMHAAIGVAQHATQALAEAEVNIEMLNQGSSEISMMFGVKDVDQERAVKALYDMFLGS